MHARAAHHATAWACCHSQQLGLWSILVSPLWHNFVSRQWGGRWLGHLWLLLCVSIVIIFTATIIITTMSSRYYIIFVMIILMIISLINNLILFWLLIWLLLLLLLLLLLSLLLLLLFFCVVKQIVTLCGETELMYINVSIYMRGCMYVYVCVYIYMMVVDKAPPSLLVFPSVVKLGHLCNNTDINSVWWNRVGLHMGTCGCTHIFYICVHVMMG